MRLMNEQNIEPEYFSDETLWLYLTFHKEVGAAKLKEALGVIQLPAVQKLVESSLALQFLLRECWEILGDWGAIADDCRVRIHNGDRNWAVLSAFVSATTKGACAIQDAVNVLVPTAEQDQWSNRGSYLAVIDLYRAARELDNSAERITSKISKSFVEVISDYYARFCAKASCFEDLFPYFEKLSGDELKQLEQVAQEHCTNLMDGDGIQRRINAEKISLVNADVTLDLAMSKSNWLLKAYAESLAHGVYLLTSSTA